MSEINFQTWICPICFDDHAMNMEHHALCDIKDLVDMREQLTTAQKNEKDLWNICADIKKQNLLLSDDRELYMRHRDILIKALREIESDKEYYESKPHKCWKIFNVIDEALKQIGVEG